MREFKINKNESDWDEIRTLLRNKKAFNISLALADIDEVVTLRVRYDRATKQHYAWFSDSCFYELKDVLS